MQHVVSVIIACYNAERFVEMAIHSALEQTGVDVEVIAVDDASTDGTRVLLQRIAAQEPRVRPILSNTNKGPAAARNCGIGAATGQWIAILDADDRFARNRLKLMLERALETGADLVADNQILVAPPSGSPSMRGQQKNMAFDLVTPGSSIRITLEEFIQNSRTRPGCLSLGYMKFLMRRDFLLLHKLAYDERRRVGEDFRFAIECLINGAVLTLMGDALYFYSERADSLTLGNNDSLREVARCYRDILDEIGPKLSARSDRTLRIGLRNINHRMVFSDFVRLAKRGRYLDATFELLHAGIWVPWILGGAVLQFLRRRMSPPFS